MGLIPATERQARPLTALEPDDYCRERWGFARNYANKVIAAAEVMTNLGTNVPIIPATKSQARPPPVPMFGRCDG